MKKWVLLNLKIFTCLFILLPCTELKSQNLSPTVNVYFTEFKLADGYVKENTRMGSMVSTICRELRLELERELVEINRRHECVINVLRREKMMDADYEFLKLQRNNGLIRSDSAASLPLEAEVLIMGYLRIVPGIRDVFIELSTFYRENGILKEVDSYVYNYSGDLRELEDDLLRRNSKAIKKVSRLVFHPKELNNLLRRVGQEPCFPNLTSEKVALVGGGTLAIATMTTGIMANNYVSRWTDSYEMARSALEVNNTGAADSLQSLALRQWNTGNNLNQTKNILQYPSVGLLAYAGISLAYKLIVQPNKRRKKRENKRMIPLGEVGFLPTYQFYAEDKAVWGLNLSINF